MQTAVLLIVGAFVRAEPLDGGGHHVTFEAYAWHKGGKRLSQAKRIVAALG